ncbi:MAG: hydroxyacid dehydrogenase [Bacillota bacterium]
MYRIMVTDRLAEPGLRMLSERAHIHLAPGISYEQLLRSIPEYHGLVVRSCTRVTGDIIHAGTKLKVIGRAGSGLDNIDLAAASSRGIQVVNVPGANTLAAAEHTFALLLALSRHVCQAFAHLRDGGWDRSRFMGIELFGKTLGIIGLGRVGTEVAKRAIAFGMRAIGYDPCARAPEGVTQVGLSELLSTSDIVSLHAALTPESRGLLNRERLNMMKPGSLLLNTARGALVDSGALYEALQSGHLAGAGLDVFEIEPPGKSPLLSLENVVATPHLGSATYEAQVRCSEQLARRILEVLTL